ncbi:hypothetical protein O9929_20450 [Vibrio lentus]|nr:hypothetical protein [Vibrio lentus]
MVPKINSLSRGYLRVSAQRINALIDLANSISLPMCTTKSDQWALPISPPPKHEYGGTSR